MKPKQHLIDAARADGTMNRANQLLSAVQILNCTANSLLEEANDLLRKKSLCLGEIKKLHGIYVRSADMYFKEFSKFVLTEKEKMDMFSDMEEFEKIFKKWAKL